MDEGKPFTISGVLTVEGEAGPAPVAGERITVRGGSAGTGRAVTDAQGRYSVRLIAKVTGRFTAEWWKGTSGEVAVGVRARPRMSLTEIVPVGGKVRIRGHYVLGAGSTTSQTSVRLTFQQGRTAKGPWKTVRKVTSRRDQNREFPFSVSVKAAKLGYWRIGFAGGRDLLAVRSPALRAYRTKVSPFRLSRVQAAYQSKVTISGTAWYVPSATGSAFKAAKRIRVIIEQRCGEDGWGGWKGVRLLEGRADAKGRFKGTFSAHCTGQIRAVLLSAKGVVTGYSAPLATKVPGH
ncbi:hypothetical protein GCM10010468_51350 [Actinocorallia longicatena]|uniref:Carboxypeptidase regulatory-like domain-containing protein n=1 Tax=Actinocorallia longicatena TaxID=111803 RepID=A0ABP6QHD8_9ACTN